MTLAESKLVVGVERLIEAFSDMAKKNALLIGNNVKQEELLTQIIDTITSAAAGIENCNEQE